jgi:hypothetical protein
MFLLAPLHLAAHTHVALGVVVLVSLSCALFLTEACDHFYTKLFKGIGVLYIVDAGIQTFALWIPDAFVWWLFSLHTLWYFIVISYFSYIPYNKPDAEVKDKEDSIDIMTMFVKVSFITQANIVTMLTLY